MNGVAVRRLRSLADLPLLPRVAEGVFDDSIDINAAREFLADPRHHLVVALDGEVIVGFVSAVHYVHPDKPQPELWINEVGVAPGRQGQGIGKAMLREMLTLGKELGCSVAWVLTDRDNAPAMRLYAGAGGEAAPQDAVMFEFDLTTNEIGQAG